jgi:hypothetical protein
MNRFFIALMILASTVSAFAQEGFSTLEEQMSGKEFSAAGLDKLTQQELDTLNDWIRRHSLATLATPARESGTPTTAAATDASSEDTRGFKGSEQERTPITSRILGNFRGWDGQTVFRLENGMIWAQDDKDKFYLPKETDNAIAVIEPGMFGRWRLHIEGHDTECRVKRIQ